MTESEIAPIVDPVLTDLQARLMERRTNLDVSAPAHIHLREHDNPMPAEPTAA
ncbi:MAG TPA: hypothetical protein VLL25_09585 [Acidimicrobiales bacterium]|nr:hypothetical protein [Acidimicrobiales bacterium]